jgi:hypothetical protein
MLCDFVSVRRNGCDGTLSMYFSLKIELLKQNIG